MRLIIIAAFNSHRVIGRGGATPWHIPEDLQRFKTITTGHTVLMGRKTYESIGGPLPDRRNVVLSRDEKFFNSIKTGKLISPPEIFSSLDSAIQRLSGEEKVFIIGGGEIFGQTIDRADELLLTFVDDESGGDVFFPATEEYLALHFALIREEIHPGFSFRDYCRK